MTDIDDWTQPNEGTYTGPERRVLDPAHRAEVFHDNGAYAVGAGFGLRLGGLTHDAARKTAFVHNSINGHSVNPMTYRAGDYT